MKINNGVIVLHGNVNLKNMHFVKCNIKVHPGTIMEQDKTTIFEDCFFEWVKEESDESKIRKMFIPPNEPAPCPPIDPNGPHIAHCGNEHIGDGSHKMNCEENYREKGKSIYRKDIVAGALYSFLGVLTSGSAFRIGLAEDARIPLEILQQFAKGKGLDLENAQVKTWNKLI